MPMKEEINNEDLWILVESFIRERGLVRLHLDSYNEFIKKGLQQIIDEVKRIEVKVAGVSIPGFYIELGKVEVGEPRIKEAKGFNIKVTPNECRLRGLTYSAPIYLEMELYKDGNPIGKEKIEIGDIPVMVKSEKCSLSKLNREELVQAGEDPDDPGGYFIINGTERVIVAQEDLAENRILLDVSQRSSSATHVAKVISAIPGQRSSVTVERSKEGILYITFPAVPGRIPLFIVLRALGLKTDQEISEAISHEPVILSQLYPSFIEMEKVPTPEAAIEYIGNRVAHGRPREKRIEAAELVLDRNLLPHLGTTKEARLKKAYYLAQMANAVIEADLGMRPLDDKDHYKNKRLKLAGDLLAILFRSVFNSFVKDVVYQLEKLSEKRREEIELSLLVRSDIITEKIMYALATGNWVGGKTGVSQLLDRTNYLSTLSHLRRVVSPLSRTQPHFEARDLHPTQWGRICPVETPEGPNCGLVKNLALLATVSVGGYRDEVKSILLNNLKITTKATRDKDYANIYLDGELIGRYEFPEKLVENIRKLRRKRIFPYELSIVYYEKPTVKEIHINTDAGRILRPVLIVEEGKIKLKKEHIEKIKSGELTWSDLLGDVIEYLDAEEEENAYIAVDYKNVTTEHTHAELPPATILGLVASVIPYADHNHSPRNTFEAAMGKQALGFPFSNPFRRADSRAHLLHYPQIPLVITKTMKISGVLRRPFGQNMVVAVLSYTGYNIQDAIIINKSSVDRGLARSTFFRLYEAEEHRYPGGTHDSIEIPQPGIKGYYAHEFYAKLDEDGVIIPELEVKGGEVLIGKTSPPRFLEEFKEVEPRLQRRDTSVMLRHEEKGIVDTVIMTNTTDDNVFVRVKVRDNRIAEIGDKFASRHGQKGVIGILLNQEDMPFTESGIVPDLIINPHAIPSRMTIGQLLESIAGKYAALSGHIVDGTPFEGVNEKTLREELEKYGFKSTGKEIMYNGLTGEKMVAEVFIGIVYYQKLHHMVSDKIHARARGPVQILTRQPTEGRAREGGLRFGEMERDCLIAYGASSILQDVLLEMSDPTYIYVCKKCYSMAYFDSKKNSFNCHFCGYHQDIAKVKVAYAFKLLLQELMSMCIYPRLIVEEKIKRWA
jgi:DNA-directed RNA polymerase subunit B